jgi:glyceraldehyde 3-phosphate dehydrogenase
VPTPTVSLVDLVANLSRETTKEEVNNMFRNYAAGPMKGIMAAVDEELVSADFRGDSHSSIVDLPSTFVLGKKMVKVLSWYDNEWGFSSRMCDLLTFVMK